MVMSHESGMVSVADDRRSELFYLMDKWFISGESAMVLARPSGLAWV
jgi:hypothetical protein